MGRSARVLIVFLVLGSMPMFSAKAHAAFNEPFLGEIRIVGLNFAPRGFAFCDGQILQISQNSALFSILGTTFGGDGKTTFALPDLRGRTTVHVGDDTALGKIKIGQKFGSHKAAKSDGDESVVPNSLALRYVIALTGVFPPRKPGATDRFNGEIVMFAGDYTPFGWPNCDGQSLSIAENKALYGAFGKTYGGTETTFRLPDLRGRTPVHAGTGPGLSPIEQGERGKARKVGIAKDANTTVMTPAYMGIKYSIVVDGLDPANQSVDAYIGEIRMLAGKATPRGWSTCDGQILPIKQHSAMFSLLGTTFGGDGRTTFGLPDLRGRSVVHAGSGTGLSRIRHGQKNSTVKMKKGGAKDESHIQPNLGVHFLICRRGIFPSRN